MSIAAPISAAPISAAHVRDAFERQRAGFLADGFPPLHVRIDRLRRLEQFLLRYEKRFVEALYADFGGRSPILTRAADILGGIGAIRFTQDSLETWMAPEPLDIGQPDVNVAIHHAPRGVVGAIIPWNGPVLLGSLAMTGILAAGNRVLLKLPELAPTTSRLMAEGLTALFDPAEVAPLEGGPEIAEALTGLPLDHILFTGSTKVGRKVMQAASANLVPVTLELGGKSPAVITRSADMTLAAARLTQAKLAFGGQVCVTPDYVLAPGDMINGLADGMLAAAHRLYPTIAENDDYTAIISDRYYGRLQALIDDARAKGADIRTVNHDDVDTGKRGRKFPFTIVIGAHDDMAIMQEEIFGPILPIIASDRLEHSLRFIRSRPHPLAAYYFGTDDAEIGLVTSGIQTGSIVINDALCQIFYEQIPFGGVGASGMGRYRGHEGFKTFSNSVSVVTQRSDEAVLASQRPPFGPDVDAYFDSQIAALRQNEA